MKALDLGGVRRALVVAPHPDDETIGAFGLIRTLRDRGALVGVVVVTDGAASHRRSRRWPPYRLRRERRRETRRMMARAGVPRQRIRFLDYDDASLGAFDAAQRRVLARVLGRGPRPDLLVLPALHDDHPDHRAVARAAIQAWPGRTRRLSYLVWPRPDGERPARRRALKLGRTRTAMKRAAIRGYYTQTGGIDDDPEGFRLTAAMIARFSRPLEIFGDSP